MGGKIYPPTCLSGALEVNRAGDKHKKKSTHPADPYAKSKLHFELIFKAASTTSTT